MEFAVKNVTFAKIIPLPNMFIAGITGGIGSGKSLICRVLRTFGVPVFCADEQVKQMYNSSHSLQQQLIQRFGAGIYQNGSIQTSALAHIVFEDDTALAEVEAMVYPILQTRFEQWRRERSAEGIGAAAFEAALLCESGFYKQMSMLVNVAAPENIRTARAQARGGASADEVRQRMRRQWSDEQRGRYADFTIINDNQTALLPQILTLHTKLLTYGKG